MISKRSVLPYECPQETRHEQHFLCTSHNRGLKTWNVLQKKKTRNSEFFWCKLRFIKSHKHTAAGENFNQVVSQPLSFVCQDVKRADFIIFTWFFFFYSVLVLIGPIWLFTCGKKKKNLAFFKKINSSCEFSVKSCTKIRWVWNIFSTY